MKVHCRIPFLLLLPCLLCLPWFSHAAETNRPNILFIIADQWRAQAFGYAGDPNVRTPHLDRFEKQSVHFTQAVAGMPVCSPTRASLLTGQRPQTHGVFINDVPLSTNAVTLPKVLKAAGYDTGCIGKWHIDGHGSRSASSRANGGRDLSTGKFSNALTPTTTRPTTRTGRRN